MCILFLYVNDGASPDGFQVIVATNRDEFFNRPAKPAHFWNDGRCISGIDLQEDRGGGTWFGASVTGKVAALLNISQKVLDPEKQGRGHLVRDFISSDVACETYCSKVAAEGDNYNGFNLLLLEKRDSHWSVHYCSNRSSPPSTTITLPDDGIVACSNTPLDEPFMKVVNGRQKFSDIVKGATVSGHDELVQRLFAFLGDKSCNLPDRRLEAHPNPIYSIPAVQAAVSAVFVDLAAASKYGTRTQTLLLIDAQGKGEFVERTMQEPIDPTSPVWNTVTHQFTLT